MTQSLVGALAGGYNVSGQSAAPYQESRPQTVRERLAQQLADTTRRHAELTEAVEILERNPDLERLLGILSRHSF